MPWLDPPAIMEDPLLRGQFMTMASMRYEGRYEDWVIPTGQATDLMSNPPFLHWLMNPQQWIPEAIFHDWNWRNNVTSKKDADGLFRRMLIEAGMPRWRAYIAWGAVRLASITTRAGGASSTPMHQWFALPPLWLATILFVAIPTIATIPFILIGKLLDWISRVGH